MKILILTRTLQQAGGAEKVISNLTRLLGGEMDFVVVCANMDGENPPSFPLVAKRVDVDLEWTLPVTSLLGKAARMHRRLKRLTGVLEAENPDVILSNFTYLWHLLVLTAKALHLTTKPVIIRIGNPVWQETHARGALYRALLRIGARWADRFIVNSADTGRDLRATLGVSPDRVVVINNPIPMAEIRSLAEEPVDSPAFSDGVPVVVSVGRLATQKNYPLLLRAFRRVRDQLSARLVVVGAGHAEALIRQTSDDLGLREDVVFAGFQANPFGFMKRASVFALSSDYEGFPSVLVEAMVTGCPVVSTDCPGGPREILRDGEDGVLVRVGDEAALADGILRLLRDPALRERYARRGLERAKAFDAPLIARSYARLFASLAAG